MNVDVSSPASGPLPPILVADDDPNDLFFLRRALLKAKVKNAVVSFSDGRELVDFLKAGCLGENYTGILPCLVLLDIKMPRLNGFAVLEWARAQKALKDVTFVMLSGSGEASDIRRAELLGARQYLVKPVAPDDLHRLIAALGCEHPV